MRVPMTGALPLTIAIISALAVAKAKHSKPNILMIVADDLGYADLAFMNKESIALTPNLNALAKKSVVLKNHHVQPVCSPTRATLLTGRHVLRYGLQNTVIWPQDAFAVPQNETLLSQNMKAAGYRTAQFGKWHLGLYKKWALPMSRGFDEQYGYYLGGEDYWTHKRNGGLDWHRNDSLAETGDAGTYSAPLLGAAAVDFIWRHRSPATPWFIYLAFQSVHSPLQAPDDCIARFPHLTGTQQTRAAMVAALDDAIGNITQMLSKTSQMDDTVIVFTADNGAPYGAALWEGDDKDDALLLNGPSQDRPPNGEGTPPHGGGGGSNYPLSGWKHWVFEGGVRSVSFVFSSDLNGGTEHAGLFHSTDWLPTLVNLAGGSTKDNLPLDGFDIWESLKLGGKASPRTEIPVNIAACGGASSKTQSIIDGPQAAIIVGDLKLIVDCYWRETKKLNTSQLYNLSDDAAEEKDLASSRPADVSRLAARLAYWEAQSVPPYSELGIEHSCGEGKAHGSPLAWNPWCDGDSASGSYVV